MYVSSYEYHCVYVLNESGQSIRPVIGRHGKGELQFIGPKQVACCHDKLYVMESLGNRIQVINETTGQFVSYFGIPHRMETPPRAFCVSLDGCVYIANERKSVCIYHSSGMILHTFDTGISRALTGIALDNTECNIHVSSHSGVRVFTTGGDHLRDYATDKWATGVTVLSNGLALVTSKGCLSVYSSCGRLICDYRGLFYPLHVTMAPDESIWITCEEGIVVLPNLCLPPFSLSLQAKQSILLQMDTLPISLLPPYFIKVFSEWSHSLDITIDNSRSECVKVKQGIPLPVVHQFVCFKLNLPTSSVWFKGRSHCNQRLCVRDGTFDQEWIKIRKFYLITQRDKL